MVGFREFSAVLSHSDDKANAAIRVLVKALLGCSLLCTSI